MIGGNKGFAEYHQALGVFVEMYAGVEATLQHTLWTVAGVEIETGKAIWRAVRLTSSIETLKRICAARSESIPPDVLEAFAQMASITELRDRLLHYGSQLDHRGNRFVTTLIQAHIPEVEKKFTVSPVRLNAATTDMMTCIARFCGWKLQPSTPEYQDQYEKAVELAKSKFQFTFPAPAKRR